MKTLRDYIEASELPTIYCDLDETLVDFYKGVDSVLSKFGYPDWQDSHWDDFTFDQAQEIRWAIVNKEPNLWLKMQWLKDGQKLWSYIKPYDPHILSHATEYSPQAVPQKLQWVQKNIGINNPDRIHIVLNRSDKARYAKNADGSPNVLIDDYIKNCNDWKSAGGIAIHHISASSTIAQLKKLGFN